MNDVCLTTDSLIAGLRAKSDPHWMRFVRLFGPLVVQWIKRAGVSPPDVEDIAQEVFLAASKGIEKYRHESGAKGSFRRWLWGITRHRLQRHFGNIKETPRGVGGTNALNILADLPETPFEESDASTLRAAQQRLAVRALHLMKTDFEDRTWQAFWMTVIDGRTSREVAEALEMSTNQVRQYRSRVLRKLRAEFGSDLDVLLPS